ncbi:2375_t:CDS:2, partial [Racocetra persica]
FEHVTAESSEHGKKLECNDNNDDKRGGKSNGFWRAKFRAVWIKEKVAPPKVAK